MTGKERNEDIIGGVILIIIGLLFLLGNVYGISIWSLIATYWPLILIVIGAGIIFKNWRR